MTERLESALALTVAEKTARFWSVNRRAGPSGQPLRMMSDVTEGIVDFASRRAITRSVSSGAGLFKRLAKRTADVPMYTLLDGTSSSACFLGRWQEPEPSWPSELPRNPTGLSLLDLIRPESLLDVTEAGHEQVRSQATTRYALKLDVDRIQWPEPDRRSLAAENAPRAARLISMLACDPRPKGVLPVEVWVDEAGRLIRFSYRPVPDAHPKHAKAPWPTTELWDFGVPPQLEAWEQQPVIDPETLSFPESEHA